jgi:anti-sigma28 factor (negative regulator of flagellin synthesis)
MWAQVFGRLADGVVMANTGKYTAPSRNTSPAGALSHTGDSLDSRLSPKVEALRKLVASGQYQVSPRYLAHRIMRTAGVRPE